MDDEAKETSNRPVLSLVQRSLVKTVHGRSMRFVEPGAGAEAQLQTAFASGDVSAYVNELIAVCVAEPSLTAADVAALPERARARARVAVAEVLGVVDDYRRLSGTGDERLDQAMRIRNERLAERIRALNVAVNDNVVRIARDAQRTLNQLGSSAAVAGLAEALSQANRMAEQMRPAFEWVEQNRRLFANIAATQQRLVTSVARNLDVFVRPAYFGALADVRRQTELVRPHYAETVAKSLGALHDSIAPRIKEIASFTIASPVLKDVAETITAVQRAIAPDIARLVGSFSEGLRRTLADAAAAYAAWLERHWPEVYANPDHPAPVLFLIAALPMSVALPIYEAVEDLKRDDELLDGLELALQSSTLLDQVEAAVHSSGDLDPIAKRRLIVALEAVRDGHYIDAAPPLSQGLERAFFGLARDRGIIDADNKFLVKARTSKAKKVEDLFEHLGIDYGYRRYLNAWVFGDFGNPARHGMLVDEAAHRRWVLRAFAALLGWFEYCAGDEQPMRQLVAQLELSLASDSQAS